MSVPTIPYFLSYPVIRGPKGEWMVSKTENLEYKIVAERDHAPPWLLAVSQSYPYTPPEIPSYSQTDHNGQNESQPDPHLDELHTFHECRESYCGPRQNDRHDNGPRPDKQNIFDPPALRKSRQPRKTNKYKTNCHRCGSKTHNSTRCPVYPWSNEICKKCYRYHPTTAHKGQENC